MIHNTIRWSLANRALVLLLFAILGGLGGWAVLNTPVDAIPDLSDTQVIIYSQYAGQSPEVVEDQVTNPLTTAFLSVPGAQNVRGYSYFGYSLVYVIFEDGTDLYWARSRVLEYLNFARDRLPNDVNPQLGPDATGVGWIYMYTLAADAEADVDLSQLRSIQDWQIKYDLMSVPGVAEVASVGGYVKQYQVEVDPEKLRAYGIPLSQIRKAIQRSNASVGGKLIEMGETEFMVRSNGYIANLEDIRNIPLKSDPTTLTPILLRQVADVHLGPEIRRGLAEMNGEGEVVSGIVIMRSGENAMEVIDGVKEKLASIQATLPDGVVIHESYDRSNLISRAIKTLQEKLLEEILVVALICLIFLLHFRSAMVAIVALPISILISFLIMKLMGINANIMSLGGIALAIGVMVDASVVMVENLHKHLERDPKKPHLDVVLAACKEVGPALFFSLLIVTISFLPVFSLEQQEGRLFAPLAFTKTFSMAAASIVAITLIPVLMFYFVRGKMRNENANPISRFLKRLYGPVLDLTLSKPKTILIAGIVFFLLSLFPLSRLGSEFMPPLNEGDLLYMPTTPPGISITKAKELLQQTNKLIKTHPAVEHVLGKIGRAETATDPAPLSMIETTIILKPRDEWESGETIENIARELDARIQFPGLTNAWTMPIKTRIDMLATGIKTPVGIKLMGDDLKELSKLGTQVEALMRAHPDVLSAYAERAVGGKFIDVDINRLEAGRFGLTISDVQEVVQSAIGGMNISETVEGLERYPINLRFPRELRNNLESLRQIPVFTPLGLTVPLGSIAEISINTGAPMIKSENARRTAWVYVDLKTSDVGGFVEAAKALVKSEIDFPAGVSVIWSGQYEYMERAKEKLALAIPLTILIILVLLFLHFRNLTESLIVLLTLPFSLVGGIWLIYLAGYNLSVAVAIGFIALAGLAAETSVVMMVYLDQALKDAVHRGQMGVDELKNAIRHGALERLRPKVMTVATTIIGLLPIMFGTETGTRVMKRVAAPMVGGLLSSVLLTLIIIPAIYLIWQSRKLDQLGNDQ